MEKNIAAFVIFIILGLFSIAFFNGMLAKVDKGHIALIYEGGPLDGNNYIKTLQPGCSLTFIGFLNKKFQYPVTQRDYIISKKPDEGDVKTVDFFVAQGKDGARIVYECATYFYLNLEKVQKFHEQIGLKYSAWNESGWDEMLKAKVRPQIENALLRESQKYSAIDIYKEKKIEIEKAIAESIGGNINDVLGDNFFIGFRFIFKSVEPEDANLLRAITENQISETQIITKNNEVEQAKRQAQAIKELGNAMRDNPQYPLLKAIESGKIQFWVIPNNVGLNIPAPK